MSQLQLERKPQTIEILGVKVHKVTMEEALEHLEYMAQNGRPQIVITLNTEMVMLAQRNQEFRKILNNAALVLPDAVGLVWASRVLGEPLPERMAGVDTVERFASNASRKNIRFFLLGAAHGVADKVAHRLQERYPGLVVSGTYAGSPYPDDEEQICKRIIAAAPHVLLVAYRVPEQEFWIARNLQRLDVPVVINVGATFDFIAGVIRRAPLWMQKHGLEWLYRLICQPSRWRRVVALPRFVIAVLHYRFTAPLRK